MCCALLLSLVQLPWTVTCQAPLSSQASLGVSRQEYWNELLCLPPGDLPNPGIKPIFPTLQADSLPSEPPGKPKNSGVGSLSLLQGIFLTQESNPSLLHCRWIVDSLPAELPGKPSLTILPWVNNLYSLDFTFTPQ